MIKLRPYRPIDLPTLVEVWNKCFPTHPNFIHLEPADLRRRAFALSSFDPDGIYLAFSNNRVLGFVHCEPRIASWDDLGVRGRLPHEGHIYALVAPPNETALIAELLEVAENHLKQHGAKDILLSPSWVYGAQPYYNTIAGAYEIPGLSLTREDVIDTAASKGYTQIAEYGTPERKLEPGNPLGDLREKMLSLRRKAKSMGLKRRFDPITSSYFPSRISVDLLDRRRIIASAAFGPWPEYQRHYGRAVYGITSVHVATDWRGRDLGKLVVMEAMEAASNHGAEAVHLHVWKSNIPAWNLYHRSLKFQPTYTWITLQKKLS